MRGLKICLWVAAVTCLLMMAGLFAPISSWEAFTKYFGVETLPADPVFEYFLRTTCTAYITIGIFFIILATNPKKYGIMVPFSALSAIALGLTCLITGMMTTIPPAWFLGDAISCLVLGLLVLVFYREA